jgi:hypothetical protein
LQVRTTDPKASLTKMAVLHRGGYYWEVQGRTRDAAGEVEQESAPARAYFVINLPELPKPKLPEGQAFYGR